MVARCLRLKAAEGPEEFAREHGELGRSKSADGAHSGDDCKACGVTRIRQKEGAA